MDWNEVFEWELTTTQSIVRNIKLRIKQCKSTEERYSLWVWLHNQDYDSGFWFDTYIVADWFDNEFAEYSGL